MTLKYDIQAKLDNIKRTQQEAYTPDARIMAYRENIVQLGGAKSEINDLKSLLAQASSAGTMFGFIGGAQVFSVWGIVFILITGFVFMLLYVKLAIRKLKTGETKQESQVGEIYSKPLPKRVKPIWLVIVVAVILGSGARFLVSYFSKGHTLPNTVVEKEQKQPVPTTDDSTDSTPSEINVTTEKGVLSTTNKKILVKIPEGARGVNIRSEPSLSSKVITYFSSNQTVYQYSESGDWLEIGINVEKDGKIYTRGWINNQFVEEP